jgi:phytoene desaturase
MSKKISIIGAGFSGLSAACYLAKAGYDVTIYEKHGTVGGRARSYSDKGFTFDMGPSWYWMPDVFEKFFSDFGKKVSDYYELVRLSPSYRVYFEKEIIDLPSSEEDLYSLFEKHEPGSALKLKKFLKEAQYKYDVGINNLVYKPGISITELFDKRLLAGLFKLDVFKSISEHIRQHFSNPKLIQILEFPVLFLGAAPENTPALYSLMNYADLSLGTWYPLGGMVKIAEGMKQLATELGVKFETNVDVKSITVKDELARTIESDRSHNGFSALVSSADYHFTEQHLLPEPYRKYSSSYWEKRKLAPSCIVYYLGVNKQLPGLLHHNLFFDEDFGNHAKEIYSSPKWPEKPLFYL